MLFIALFGIALGLLILWWCIEYYRHFKGIWKIPISKFMFPIFGHIFLVTNPEEMFKDVYKLAVDVGKFKYFRGTLGLFYMVGVTDPKMLENLHCNTAVLNKSKLYHFLHRWLGTGLLTSPVEKWRGRRKLLTPAYHFKILEQFIEVFDRNTKIMVKKMSEEVGKEKTDIFPYVTLCALDNICESAMGTVVNAQECADSEYVKAINHLANALIVRTTSVLKQWDFYYQFTNDYREEIRNLKIVHGYTMSVIQARRTELLHKGNLQIQAQDEDFIGCKVKRPFLDVLLQADYNGAPLSDEDIREEVDTFMFEGHDTVSSAISFALYSISRHPFVQARLLEEQRAIFGTNPDRMTTYQDLQEMKYMEMVIKETLRLYPSVPMYAREVVEDFTYDEFRFKKGTHIVMAVYSLHRNPEIYPKPEVFDPERFTPEEQGKIHPFAYLPFSAGFRNCIGQKFAMTQMKTTLSRVIRKLVLHSADEEVRLKSGMILSSHNGAKVRIANRLW